MNLENLKDLDATRQKISDDIFALMKEHALSLNAVSTMSSVGPQAISNFLLGKRKTNIRTLLQLSSWVEKFNNKDKDGSE